MEASSWKPSSDGLPGGGLTVVRVPSSRMGRGRTRPGVRGTESAVGADSVPGPGAEEHIPGGRTEM